MSAGTTAMAKLCEGLTSSRHNGRARGKFGKCNNSVMELCSVDELGPCG